VNPNDKTAGVDEEPTTGRTASGPAAGPGEPGPSGPRRGGPAPSVAPGFGAPRDAPFGAPGRPLRARARRRLPSSGTIGNVHDLAETTTGPDLRDDPDERPVPPRLSAAVDLARAAAVDAADGEADQVGEALAVHAEDPTENTLFSASPPPLPATKPGYRGWTWAVTLMAPDDPEAPVTVGEVALLPGAGAVVAPEWVPWNERVRAEDLAPGDLLPVDHDDDRLVPAHASLDDDVDPAGESDENIEQIRAVADELGFGRPRVMSPEGRLDAAARWVDGDFGPAAEMARAASAHCGTCGFYLALAGSLRGAFGVCGNGNVPADGRVVHAEHGCGGHSELQVDTGSVVMASELVYDDGVDMETPEPVAATSDADGS
jgi:hypothetical protein